MYNPEDILTKHGCRDLDWHLYNLEKAIFYLTNNADDLHIGCFDDKQLEVLYALEKMLPTYKNGDGEKLEG